MHQDRVSGLGARNRYYRSRAVMETPPIGFCDSILHPPMYSVEWVSGEVSSAYVKTLSVS